MSNPRTVDFRSQPNTLSGKAVPAVSRTSPGPFSGPGDDIFPVEGTVEMCFDGSDSCRSEKTVNLLWDTRRRGTIAEFVVLVGNQDALCADR